MDGMHFGSTLTPVTILYQAGEARGPSLTIHQRLRWTIARSRERVLIARVWGAGDLVLASSRHDELDRTDPAIVERSLVSGRVVVLGGKREDGSKRIDFELALKNLVRHRILTRSLESREQ